MKKNLRLLCLGLAAATFTAGFAQVENVTSKLKNADMEQGIKGRCHAWKLKFIQLVGQFTDPLVFSHFQRPPFLQVSCSSKEDVLCLRRADS